MGFRTVGQARSIRMGPVLEGGQWLMGLGEVVQDLPNVAGAERE